MELHEKTVKVCRMIETVVRSTIDPKWQFTKNGMAKLYIQRGLEQLPALFGFTNIDDERIVDYLVYQLYRQRSLLANGSWRYTYLFSQAALEKYRNQFLSIDGKPGMNYYINQWLDEAELTRKQLVAMIEKPKPDPLKNMVYMASEEPIKMRFLNTDCGLALCQNATTGWSPLSAACGKCDNWAECGKLTAKKYPELMRYRKEVYHGRKEK